MLICPVRNCGMRLVREGKQVVCARRHSFDVARSGYVNLLQPQERRSKQPGDTRAAVEARRRLHERGVSEPFLEAINQAMNGCSTDAVLDAGCGDGFYLGTLAERMGFDGHGIDISVAAVDAAARRYVSCEWIVANADRCLPYSEKSFSTVLSITGRMNAGEFRRVLSRDGHLLVGIAAPEDLIELRGTGRDRVRRTIETFARGFEFAGHGKVTKSAYLDAASVADLLLSIYRPIQAQPATAMQVTLSLDLLLFRAV